MQLKAALLGDVSAVRSAREAIEPEPDLQPMEAKQFGHEVQSNATQKVTHVTATATPVSAIQPPREESPSRPDMKPETSADDVSQKATQLGPEVQPKAALLGSVSVVKSAREMADPGPACS